MAALNGPGDLWSSFPLDPRDKAYAAIRASDDDRERITAALGTAFADGRIDRDELEERMSDVAAARTLGELPRIVADLVPLKPPPARTSRSLVGVPSEELQRRALDEWQDRRRNAVSAFLGSAAFFWAIWIAVALAKDDFGRFPWPLIINALALLNLVKVVSSRDAIVRDEVRRLEKKQARQQRWPKGLP